MCFCLLGVLQEAYANETESSTVEHLIWDHTPIVIALAVGKERMVSFSYPVSVENTEPSLTTDKLKLINNQGVLYLTALQPFERTRLLVKNNQTGQVILVDVQGQAQAPSHPLQIIDSVNTAAKAPLFSDTVSDNEDSGLSFIALNRFALQQFYAPSRLLVIPAGMNRVPMHTQKIVHLVANDNVLAMPLASWRYHSQTITAILLRNLNTTAIHLTPEEILGRFKTCVFYPREDLSPKSKGHDSTTVFLISNTDFVTALGKTA